MELTVNAADGTITGSLGGAIADSDPDNSNANKVFDDVLTVTPQAGIATANGGTVTLNADGSFTYTPSETNTSGTDSFDYALLDGFGGTDTATVTITLDNANPVANDNGYGVDHNVELTVNAADGTITGVIPELNGDADPDNEIEGRLFDDILIAILAGDGTTALGGTVVLNEDGSFTYTPPTGESGVDSFSYYVNDGYDNSNTVTVAVNVKGDQPTPSIPVAPLQKLEYPVIVGCPAEMDAAAAELGVNSDKFQMIISNSMATNPGTQPCDACASLLTAAATLKQMGNGPQIAALAEIFSSLAPIDAPYTPEVSASVETALANFKEMESRLAMLTDEEYAEYQQYAMADKLVEAFVSYVAVLGNDLKIPDGDSLALVMDKYGDAIEATGNPNIGTYLIEKMEMACVTSKPSEPLIASID